MEQQNITYFSEYKLHSVASINSQKKLGVSFVGCGKDAYIEADYLLIAIGRHPQKDFYTDELCIAEKRLIKEGRLFLAGDVKNDICRQVAIALGDGVLAAMKIFYNIGKHESKDHRYCR
jgi:thioredoxin reductase